MRIDLSMNGIDDFKRANSMIDDFLETMKEASRITDKFKNAFSGFGGDTSREMNKARDSIKDVYHGMDSAKGEINKLTGSVHKVQQEFRYTSDAAKKIKLNSGLNNDINKSAEEVKKLAKSADQSGNKFSEMFRKLRSGSILAGCRKFSQRLNHLLLFFVIELSKGIDKGTVRCFKISVCHLIKPPDQPRSN